MDPWGLSRYAYVEGNPLIRVDPTGHDGGWLGGLVSAVTSTVSSAASTVVHVAQAVAPAAGAVLDATTGIPSMINDVKTIFSGNASTLDKIMAGADLLINVAMDVSMVVGVGEGLRAAYVGAKIAGHVAMDVGEHALAHEGEDAVAHVAEHDVTGAFRAGAEGGEGLGKLAGRQIRVSEKGLDLVSQHLAQFGEIPENGMMMGRLRSAFAEGRTIAGADASFYIHEANEATLMNHGMAYEEAHQAALTKYGVSPFSVYAPEVIQALPDTFNANWRRFWGIDR